MVVVPVVRAFFVVFFELFDIVKFFWTVLAFCDDDMVYLRISYDFVFFSKKIKMLKLHVSFLKIQINTRCNRLVVKKLDNERRVAKIVEMNLLPN